MENQPGSHLPPGRLIRSEGSACAPFGWAPTHSGDAAGQAMWHALGYDETYERACPRRPFAGQVNVRITLWRAVLAREDRGAAVCAAAHQTGLADEPRIHRVHARDAAAALLRPRRHALDQQIDYRRRSGRDAQAFSRPRAP